MSMSLQVLALVCVAAPLVVGSVLLLASLVSECRRPGKAFIDCDYR